MQCNLLSCQLEQGYCGTLIACQLLVLQHVEEWAYKHL